MNITSTDTSTTIIAPATASGGAVMVVRLSGSRAIEIADRLFRGRQRLADADGYTLHYGRVVDKEEQTIDDVVVALFRAPHSYTGDDTVEITLHGSEYITATLLRLAIEYGATMATAGEFTRRAFLAGKMDLSRAEAVADIIASDSRWSHRVASTQMRGGYSEKLGELREELLRLCSLLELELDFSEEDVEFADRRQLNDILSRIGEQIESLRGSFALGNALKSGISVAIVGEPNVGKSTLLNALIEEDRAMVSDIAGTTRDTIEASTIIDGIRFRFVDTAGLRTTDDTLEQMGIERTRRAIDNANIVVHIASAESPEFKDIELNTEQHYIKVINKIDCVNSTKALPANTLLMSAKQGIGIDALRTMLRSTANTSTLRANDIVVSNMRHYEALTAAHTALESAMSALTQNLPADLISEDIRTIIHHLGEITGAITSDEILQSIFSKFCIGK
ncbi:MAG: tRNA uridine-5-carboxymethylaminomethyl(34) synthesis GTPase MnmE [Alistipes sp.]|nr:tRNA uridine-5-carboxymethylaminomethyl(34) synthesis GTPase MnmE [Alistipes sp.]